MNPKQIKAARRAAGLSAAEAAELVGLAHFQAWQRYEQDGPHGRKIPEPTLRLFLWLTEYLPRILTSASSRVPREWIGAARVLVEYGLVTDVARITQCIIGNHTDPAVALAVLIERARNGTLTRARALARAKAIQEPHPRLLAVLRRELGVEDAPRKGRRRP